MRKAFIVSAVLLCVSTAIFGGCGGSNSGTAVGPGGTTSNIPCTTSGNCSPPFPYCPPGGGYCVECLGDANCPNGKKCNLTLYACVECAVNADCGGGQPYCDSATGQCVECLADGNCAAGQKCDLVSHSCVYSCTSNANCSGAAGTPYCSPSGVCVECLANGNCPTDQPICLPSGSCVQCVNDTTCGGGQPYCYLPQNQCVECLTDAQCGAGRRCNPGDHVCR